MTFALRGGGGLVEIWTMQVKLSGFKVKLFAYSGQGCKGSNIPETLGMSLMDGPLLTSPCYLLIRRKLSLHHG